MSDKGKGFALEQPSYDSGAPPDDSVSLDVASYPGPGHEATVDEEPVHHEDTFHPESSNAGGDPSTTSVKPFRELSGNVYSYENERAKDSASHEVVLDQRKPSATGGCHSVEFSIGENSQERREGSTIPHQEQRSGESEVLKNLRRAEEAYVKEMKVKDGRICVLETQLVQANYKEKELSRELQHMTEEKKHAEDELRETQEEYRRVVEEKIRKFQASKSK